MGDAGRAAGVVWGGGGVVWMCVVFRMILLISCIEKTLSYNSI